MWDLPIGSPSLFLKRFVTLAKAGLYPYLGIANYMFKYVSSNISGVKLALASVTYDLLMIPSNSSLMKFRVIFEVLGPVFRIWL